MCEGWLSIFFFHPWTDTSDDLYVCLAAILSSFPTLIHHRDIRPSRGSLITFESTPRVSSHRADNVFDLGSHRPSGWPSLFRLDTAFFLTEQGARCSEKTHYTEVNCICQNVSDWTRHFTSFLLKGPCICSTSKWAQREESADSFFFFSFLPPSFPCRCIQVTVSGGFYREADQTAAPALEETPLSGTLYLA